MKRIINVNMELEGVTDNLQLAYIWIKIIDVPLRILFNLLATDFFFKF